MKKFGQKKDKKYAAGRGKSQNSQDPRNGNQKGDSASNDGVEWKFDKRKVRSYNCQKMGHFARECRGNDGNENKKTQAHLAKDEELSDLEAVKLMARTEE